MKHEESIREGVLCWQDGANPDIWHPYTIEQLSLRVAVCDTAIRKKNERIGHLCGHIDTLQTILIEHTGHIQAALYGQWYMETMKQNNFQIVSHETKEQGGAGQISSGIPAG